MTAKTPAEDVVTFLAGALASLNASGASQNIGVGGVRAPASNVPKICVFVTDGPGPMPMRTMGEVTEHRFPIVHVTVRHTKHEEGVTLMRDIIDVMRASGLSGYLDVRSMSSSPLPLPRDREGLHSWNNSFTLVYEQS